MTALVDNLLANAGLYVGRGVVRSGRATAARESIGRDGAPGREWRDIRLRSDVDAGRVAAPRTLDARQVERRERDPRRCTPGRHRRRRPHGDHAWLLHDAWQRAVPEGTDGDQGSDVPRARTGSGTPTAGRMTTDGSSRWTFPTFGTCSEPSSPRTMARCPGRVVQPESSSKACCVTPSVGPRASRRGNASSRGSSSAAGSRFRGTGVGRS